MGGTARVAVAVAAMLSSACELFTGGPVTADGIFLPRHRTSANEPQMGAALSGVLELEGRCLWVRADTQRYLAIWPPGTTVARQGGHAVFTTPRGAAKTGDRIISGGGERKDVSDFQGALGRDAPPDCRSELYWIVSNEQLRVVYD